MSTRSRIKAFEIFTKALARLEAQDKELFTWPRNRITLTHALAVHIHDILEDHTYSVDLYPSTTKSRRSSNADVLVHNRQSGHQILAIVCRNDYLTEQEQKELSSIVMEGSSQEGPSCDLVLAVSFMPQKSYMLIYIANDDGVEYYHFDRNLMIMEPVRRRTIEEELNDKEQPTLVKMKRHRRRAESNLEPTTANVEANEDPIATDPNEETSKQ